MQHSPQSDQLLQTLKKQLRAAGITYADVARELELSEASVKRLFADNTFSLQRFEAVCHMAGLSISELAEINARNQHRLDELTLAQEQEIASDVVLLLVAVSAMNGMSVQNIRDVYALTEAQCIQKLARLDRLKFIELLPGNRIKLRVSPNFRWLKNGPIQQFFLAKVEKDFFNSRFQKDSEKLLVLNGICTPATNKLMQDRLEELALELTNLMKQDLVKPAASKKGNTVVIALREWQFGLFAKLAKNRPK
jgi:hypothetical protein